MPAIASTATSKPRSFVTLDFLRGIAAIPVLYVHTARLFGNRQLFPHAHLAVDFFFLLSGFVMSYVYQEKLDAGWSASKFLRARVLRLYPLYGIALLLGTAFALLWAHFGHMDTSLRDIAILFLLGLLFLPAPPQPLLPTASIGLYPLNVPSWSLFYEIIANVVHAIALRRRSVKFLGVWVGVFGIVLLPLALSYGNLGFGPERNQDIAAVCRVLFAYPLGMILYRLWNSGRLRVSVPPLLIAFLLLACLAMPIPKPYFPIYEWAIVIFYLPAILVLGASSASTGHMRRFSQWLGGLSYPLYILHVPVFDFFEQAWIKILKHRIEPDAPWSGVVFLLVLVPLAFWMGELYDPEARKLLHARVLPFADRVLRRGGREA